MNGSNWPVTNPRKNKRSRARSSETNDTNRTGEELDRRKAHKATTSDRRCVSYGGRRSGEMSCDRYRFPVRAQRTGLRGTALIPATGKRSSWNSFVLLTGAGRARRVGAMFVFRPRCPVLRSRRFFGNFPHRAEHSRELEPVRLSKYYPNPITHRCTKRSRALCLFNHRSTFVFRSFGNFGTCGGHYTYTYRVCACRRIRR